MAAHTNRELLTAIALAGATVAALIASKSESKKKRISKQPRYLRSGIIRPIRSAHNTPWRWLLAFRKAPDFIVSINITKACFFDRLLPLYANERPFLSFGSPYRKAHKTPGRPPLLDTVDILGMALWYIKDRGCMYRLCVVFGIVPSSVSVWLDFALELLLRVVQKQTNTDFEVRWPTSEEMKQSAGLLELYHEYGHILRDAFTVADGARIPYAEYSHHGLADRVRGAMYRTSVQKSCASISY